LQSNGIRVVPEGLTIDDPRARPEITRQRPQIQPFVQSPRASRNDTGTVSAYVLRKAFLRTMANIQAAEIHAYGQRNAFFEPPRNCLHETPHGIA
jgi:hypothetical protein